MTMHSLAALRLIPPRLTLLRSRLFALFVLACAVPGTSMALEFECSAPGDTRYLRVDIPGEEHLCEVSVTSGIGGERRVMWYADNDTQFCSGKIYELRDKYTDEFAFDCSRRSDRDGIDDLSPRHRAILDTELKSLLGTLPGDGVDPVVRSVRAAASSLLPEPASWLALQFFMADGTDRLYVVADEDERWETLVDVRGLAANVPEPAGLDVLDAFVDTIDEGGSLDVLTLLARDGGRECEGRLTLQAGADGTLVPVAPHRHLCRDIASAIDAG